MSQTPPGIPWQRTRRSRVLALAWLLVAIVVTGTLVDLIHPAFAALLVAITLVAAFLLGTEPPAPPQDAPVP
ncbi:MAG: hypothetical protein H2042_17225, partial [Rhizobiales bacterium]|nr:hypothetical protein [Hyphomicrobiales bacterium]